MMPMVGNGGRGCGAHEASANPINGSAVRMSHPRNFFTIFRSVSKVTLVTLYGMGGWPGRQGSGRSAVSFAWQRCCLMLSKLRGVRHRQPEAERAALAKFALDPDFAAMSLDHRLDQAQT